MRETQNKGKKFWTCSAGKDDGCDFFVRLDFAKVHPILWLITYRSHRSGRPTAAVLVL